MSARTDAEKEATERAEQGGWEYKGDHWYKYYNEAYDRYGEDQAMDYLMGVEAPQAQSVDWEKIYKGIAQYNEETYRRLYPESMIAAADTGNFFNQWYRGQARETNLFNREQAEATNVWLKDQTTDLNKYLRGEAAASNAWTLEQVGQVNEFNAEQFYKAMDTALPGLLGTAQSYKASVDSMLAGELPDAVKSQISQAAAERGIRGGVYGPAAQNAQLRDLGLNTLQYIQAGQQGAQALPGMARSLMPDLAQPNIIQNPMINPSFASPTPTYGQIANLPGIQSNIMSQVMGLTAMQPVTGIQAEQQNAQNALQAGQFNSQLQYSQAMSQLGYYQDQQTMAWQKNMFDQQMNQAQNQMWVDLFGSIFGAGASMLSFGF